MEGHLGASISPSQSSVRSIPQFLRRSPAATPSIGSSSRGLGFLSRTSPRPEIALSPLNGFQDTHSRHSSHPSEDAFGSGSRSSFDTFEWRARSAQSHAPWNSTIAEATHQMLMDNRNIDHMQLFHSHSQLQEELEQAKIAYKHMNIRLETLNTAYSELVNAVSVRLSSVSPAADISTGNLESSSSSTDHLKILNRSDYDGIRFWTEHEYLQENSVRQKAKGKATMADAQSKRGSRRLSVDDENVMCWFIEDENGIQVSGSRIRAMRSHARKIWAYLHSEGKAPAHWNDATSVVRNYYASEMRLNFPELRFCELDYKSHRIATDSYPGWSKPYFEKNGLSIRKSKLDPALVEQEASDVVSGAKREACEPLAAEPVAKKQKLAEKSARAKSKTSKTSGNPSPPAPAPPKTHKPLVPVPSSSAIDPGLPADIPAPLQSDIAVTSSASTSTSSNSATIPSATHCRTCPGCCPSNIMATIPKTKPESVKHVSEVNNPLASLGHSTGPTARSEFVDATSSKDQKKKSLSRVAKTPGSAPEGKVNYLRATNSTKPRNLCLKEYIKEKGKVTKVVFDTYMANLSPAELKKFVDRSAAAAKAAELAANACTLSDLFLIPTFANIPSSPLHFLIPVPTRQTAFHPLYDHKRFPTITAHTINKAVGTLEEQCREWE
ncbi:hypothetical protein B0H10DRAFT_2197057 [Mycena sp. CBHHK59/15]|nr:hypothetical protein B0H10DRAFT_2197057 [Mycena sp. CBHHK59/15]